MKSFITRRRLATLLDVKTATVGSWDRHGRGVDGHGPIYLSATNVVYLIEDVERFLKGKYDQPPAFVAPQERAAGAEALLNGRPDSLKTPPASNPDDQGPGRHAGPRGEARGGQA